MRGDGCAQKSVWDAVTTGRTLKVSQHRGSGAHEELFLTLPRITFKILMGFIILVASALKYKQANSREQTLKQVHEGCDPR